MAASVSEPVREAAADGSHAASLFPAFRSMAPGRQLLCLCALRARAETGQCFPESGPLRSRARAHAQLLAAERQSAVCGLGGSEGVGDHACARRPTENRERNGLVFLCKSVGFQVSADGGILGMWVDLEPAETCVADGDRGPPTV